jgi:hypothetical protein
MPFTLRTVSGAGARNRHEYLRSCRGEDALHIADPAAPPNFPVDRLLQQVRLTRNTVPYTRCTAASSSGLVAFLFERVLDLAALHPEKCREQLPARTAPGRGHATEQSLGHVSLSRQKVKRGDQFLLSVSVAGKFAGSDDRT